MCQLLRAAYRRVLSFWRGRAHRVMQHLSGPSVTDIVSNKVSLSPSLCLSLSLSLSPSLVVSLSLPLSLSLPPLSLSLPLSLCLCLSLSLSLSLCLCLCLSLCLSLSLSLSLSLACVRVRVDMHSRVHADVCMTAIRLVLKTVGEMKQERWSTNVYCASLNDPVIDFLTDTFYPCHLSCFSSVASRLDYVSASISNASMLDFLSA